MSSSVSSEWAFSQGGITISKHHSCLNGDIVEALQLLKCAIQHDLLFQEPAPSSISEVDDNDNKELGNAGADGESVEVLDMEEFLWDELLIEDEDEETMYNEYN
jgi:hypothetical protein